MDSLVNWLQRSLADPLASARAASAPVGIVGFDFPLDIAASQARVFCHLPWQTGRSTPQADAWLELAFPGWARSLLQDWADGRFDLFESVVFTRGDDAAQRLYYYLCELQRRGLVAGPRPLMLDVAAIPRAGSVAHNVNALKTLLSELDVDVSCLAVGIEQANRQRTLFNRLEQERQGAGHLHENIARASLFHNPLPTLNNIRLRPSPAEACLYLAGSNPPDDTLHRVAEAHGWNIVGEMHACSPLRHGELLQPGAEPLLELARRLNSNTYSARSFSDRAGLLRTELVRTGADAVVFWLTREDEARAWDVAAQRQQCELMGKPCLVLTQTDWEFRDDAVDQLARFLEVTAV